MILSCSRFRYLKVFFLILFLFLIDNSFNTFAQDHNPPETVHVVANKNYKANFFKKILLGSHYRKEWTTTIEVPVFNIDSIHGGLKPLKQGGSRQTTNLRLEDSLGHQYVLRSVDKTNTRVLPPEFQKTLIADILQDQETSENPYGPLVIPSMAKAAGVFYTNPTLFYIPYDGSFNEYANTFAGMLAYFEERPDGDMSEFSGSGNSNHVIGTEKMFDHKYEDHDNKVDEILFAKTRLFDMLIGDWGRHEDQWRWAAFKTASGKLYKPIPRDRDHVFFKSDGVIPYLSSRKWAMRVNQNFDYHYKDIKGLNTSGMAIDRALLSSVTKEEWIAQAELLKASLTDSVIEHAVKQMPPSIFPLHGKEIIRKLKSRRDRLPKIASKYYSLLARDVDVTGSEKVEVFEVKRKNKNETEVTMKKVGGDTLYHRIFYKKETKEIRLYGLGGEDQFILGRKEKKRPRIRIIRESGHEKLTDRMNSSLFNQYIYTAGNMGNELMSSTQIIFMRSGTNEVKKNGYDRGDYHYNMTTFSPSYQFNVDDGVFLGFGIIRKTYGFKKYPYATYQTAGVNWATSTGAITFKYFGDFKKVIGKWNLNLDMRMFGPKYVMNYFGLGNESVQKDTSINYYRVRATEFLFNPLLYRNFTKRFIAGIGPQYQYVSVQNTPGRFISMPESQTSPTAFNQHQYVGIKLFTQLNTLDNIVFPKNGTRWNFQVMGLQNIKYQQRFVNFSSDVSFFYTLKFLPSITFATRVGGATNVGSFEFFQANTLGGTTNLRGYRRTRYYGRTSFYHNIEARIKIADINFYIFPGKVGLVLFYDYGRIWQDHEHSNVWHQGYGPGIYIQMFNRLAFTGTYGFGSSNSFLNIQFGFLF